MMISKIFKLSLCAVFLISQSQATYAEEQSELEKLEKQGISIGGLSDNPHRSLDEIELSEAEQLLWMTDQLENIEKTGTIHYEFERKGQEVDDFTDSVELNINEIKPDGMKSAQLEFFSGDRHQQVPPNENTNGNPVISVYLQGDVYEMNRVTEGSWRYFHRRIKFALSEAAEITPVTIDLGDKEVKGKLVKFLPYVNDPKRKLFEEYADKIYEVTVSDEIPGMLYKIHTIVPGKGTDSSAIVEETLVYAGVDFD